MSNQQLTVGRVVHLKVMVNEPGGGPCVMGQVIGISAEHPEAAVLATFPRYDLAGHPQVGGSVQQTQVRCELAPSEVDPTATLGTMVQTAPWHWPTECKG